ncbi:hypothetical protein [Desulfofundulus sp.]
MLDTDYQLFYIHLGAVVPRRSRHLCTRDDRCPCKLVRCVT